MLVVDAVSEESVDLYSLYFQAKVSVIILFPIFQDSVFIFIYIL